VTDEQLPLFGDDTTNAWHPLQDDPPCAEEPAEHERARRHHHDGIVRLLRALVKRGLAKEDLPTAAAIAAVLDEGVGR